MTHAVGTFGKTASFRFDSDRTSFLLFLFPLRSPYLSPSTRPYDLPHDHKYMPTFRRLNGPPAEIPDDDHSEVPCAAHAAGHYCFIHGSKLFRNGSWSTRQRNVFEGKHHALAMMCSTPPPSPVYWQKIQHFKFEFLGGSHLLGECDQDTFAAFAEIVGNIRGLYWDRGQAWYMCVTSTPERCPHVWLTAPGRDA